MNRLRQFWNYAKKVFNLPFLLRSVETARPEASIPDAALTISLFLGSLLRVPSLLQLEAETRRKGWQRLVRLNKSISDDAFSYALERFRVDDLRGVLVHANKSLKRNKALEQARINGLLAVAVDANEQFKSRSRCCPACCQRQIELKNSDGTTQTVNEYYHRQVYAQIHGPALSTVLDLEPIRPGEDEARAALRLLGRMRRLYGPRFFDVVTVDAWYATGPFLTAVQRLGWSTVAVLKQERYEIYQEATVLSAAAPVQTFEWNQRQVQLREVKNLPFTDPSLGAVRVVLAEEQWTQGQVAGGQLRKAAKKSSWRWMATQELEGYEAAVIHAVGHQRWGIENHLFNEMTQHYHLTHCARHEPNAILAWLFFRVLGFVFFEMFVRLNGKLWRQGKTTLQQIARELDRALEQREELAPLWSG